MQVHSNCVLFHLTPSLVVLSLLLFLPGGGLGIDVIIILGFSNIFADGLSMGMGDALSSKAERDYILAERQREAW